MNAQNTSKAFRPPHHPRALMDLFPSITPYSSGYISVDSAHTLYWEQSGNPDGVPIVMLHGGPGAGASPIHRRFFDPDHYRIIIFDQRGAGRSAPLGSIENNTAQHLVDDIEALRKHLRIDQWHLFGGSWGSTLAMLYAIQHPKRCISLVMRGIFLCERDEIDWFLHGIQTIFPEAWEQFTSILTDDERDDILEAYYARLTHEDPDVQLEAAALARLEAHYFKHELIAPNDSILSKIDIIRHIPCSIIQGRYDVICPIRTADRLHREWPEADYVVVPDAGHSALDPALRSRLIEATEANKTL